MSDDPGSLDRMHDLVLPPPVPWRPQTPGWWIVIGCASLLLIALFFATVIRWQANRYRREALVILHNSSTHPASWPAILKRCALACWPRTTVASLTGAEWDDFYQQNAGKGSAEKGTGRRIEELAFSEKVTKSEFLETSVLRWILHHRKDNDS